MTIEEKRANAFEQVKDIIGDAIRESKSIPSGHIYAMLMDKVGLNVYNAMLTKLKAEGKIKESGHLLTWIG